MSHYLPVRLLVIALWFVPVPAWAVTKDWNDGTDNWSNAAAWTPAGVPGAGDTVKIVFADDVARTVMYDYTGPPVTLDQLTVDMTGAGTNATTLSMAANALTANLEVIGLLGRGTFNQSGGTNSTGTLGLQLGTNAGSVGTYNLSGSGTLAVFAGGEIIGGSGTGNFNQSGGVHTINGAGNQLYLGSAASGIGNYGLAGGSVAAKEDEYVGYFGAGSFDNNGGINLVGKNLSLGTKGGATGTYTLSGTGQVSVVNQLHVGDLGLGFFNQSGVSSVVGASFLEIGKGSTGLGSYTLSSGTLTADASEVGLFGTGTFNQSGGIHTTGGLAVATHVASLGTYALSGGTLEVSGNEVIGAFATGNGSQSGGTFTQTGSTSVHRVGTLWIGDQFGSTGSMSLASGTFVSSGGEVIGKDGTGSLTQTSGTHTSQGDISLAAYGGSSGDYSLRGGAANAANIFVGGRSGGAGGAGLLTVSGSSTILTVPGTIKVYNTPGSNFILNSGAVNVGAINVGGVPSRFTWSAGLLNVTNDLALDSGAAPDSTSAAFGTSLSLSGTRVLKVTGNETIGGNGTFSLTLGSANLGNAVHAVTGNITLKPGGTLSASGGNLTYANFIQAGGTISGQSFRNLSNFTYQSGSFTASLINNGTVTFGSTFSVNTLQNESSMTVSAGQLLSTTGSSGITNSGTFTVNAGSISTNTFTNTGTATFTAGGFTGFNTTITNAGSFTMNGGNIPGGTVTNSGTFVLNGGTVSVNTFTNSVSGSMTAHGSFSGSLVNRGTLTVDGPLTFTNSVSVTQDGVVQGVGTISNTSGFTTFNNSAGGAINSTTPNGALTINNFSTNNAGAIINVGPTSTLSLASNNGTGGWTNSGTVILQGAGARLTGGTMTLQNGGIIQGSGLVTASLGTSNNGVIRASGGELDFSAAGIMNSTQSQIQVLAGSTINFMQGISMNSGVISLVGGTYENSNRTMTNAGTINGYGTLRTGGFTNNSGRLLSVGEGNMDVFGTVTNNGVISIQSGRSAYFFSNVSGSGSFTGTGTAVFLASLSPGNSPAQVIFAGGATLGGGTALNMELGGTTVGSGYDKIDVEGQLSIGGGLAVTRINGFMPAPWSTFDLLDWGTLSGTFSSISLPSLALGQWDTSQLYVNGTLSVALSGDFNHDAMVDDADYVVWRKGLGTIYVPGDYELWRAHYGEGVSGSGSTTSAATVPEPGAAMLWLMATQFAVLSRRGRCGLRR